MVKIRLKRMGMKKNAFYRIVVTDVRVKRDGKAIEEIGFYDVVKNPAVIKIDEEKALKWLNEGAKPTDTVRNLFSQEGIMKKFAEQKTSKPKAAKKAAPKKEETKKEVKEEKKTAAKKPAAKKTTTKKVENKKEEIKKEEK